ncbi:unnamed protein product [Peronospora belbahrii]|uniref:RWP-RK domain-containing protein n=1 Tax=Peronospora belbahrii TaxID=622444 RepID=A0AAU9L387_9STRA|nr:unnamed protein product [Peronospora belbahrii]
MSLSETNKEKPWQKRRDEGAKPPIAIPLISPLQFAFPLSNEAVNRSDNQDSSRQKLAIAQRVPPRESSIQASSLDTSIADVVRAFVNSPLTTTDWHQIVSAVQRGLKLPITTSLPCKCQRGAELTGPTLSDVTTTKYPGSLKEDNRRLRRQRRRDLILHFLMDNLGVYTLPEFDRESSAQARLQGAVSAPCEQHHPTFAPLSIITVDRFHANATRPPAKASSLETSPPRFSSDTRRHTGWRRASGEGMTDYKAESQTMQATIPQGQGDTTCCPNLLEGAVVPSAVHSNSAQELETPQKQLRQENEDHSQAFAVLPLRMSTRRTKMTTRWSPSVARDQHQSSHRASKVPGSQRSQDSSASLKLAVTLPTRPISNATQNINFDMLQPHFERPLQQAADSFCVCTTLLKKICRRNGINNWPYRKICGLRKSVASMTKQVKYFEGEQRRAYANQLKTLEHELQAYLRTGNKPLKEPLCNLEAETEAKQFKEDISETSSKIERKEVQVVPAWSNALSLNLPYYSNNQIVHELSSRPTTAGDSGATWGGAHFRLLELQQRTTAFPTPTHYRALPSIVSILQHQNYSSSSRAASTPSTTAPGAWHIERYQYQEP